LTVAFETRIIPRGSAIVQFGIKPCHGNTMEWIQYKVDTGANRTTIDLVALKTLGYNAEWIIENGKLLKGGERPTVATGTPIDDCYVVALPQVKIGDWVGYNWPFTVSLSLNFKLLLGTDTMCFFNWHFNYENNICKFDLIQGMRRISFNNKEQSIHSLV